MPKFQIVVEVGETRLLAKTYEAKSLDEAMDLAEEDAWDGPKATDWEQIDGNTIAEIREDQCKKITD